MLGSLVLGLTFGVACAAAFASSGGSLPASFIVYASAGAIGIFVIATTNALIQMTSAREAEIGL